MNEINDLTNSNIGIKEITDLNNSEFENYHVSDLNNIPLIVGPPGPTNNLSIGEVKTGETSSANITGESPNQVLNLVLEKGEKGDTGESGVYIGDTEPIDEKINVWIQPNGNNGNILKIKNSDGEFKSILSIKGDKGDPGVSNTLIIGSVTTGETSSASITGESPNQVLNLVLEKGEKGDTGPQGVPGTPAKNIVIEITKRTITSQVEQNTNYEIPEYTTGNNSLSIYFEGCKLIKDENYIEVDATHIQFKDWDLPAQSNIEIIIRKEED